jgi:glycosyltransferase involved in cell wall biosynthesis
MNLRASERAGGADIDRVEVSVLIPLYNSAATIERAVRSAMQQTLRNIEVLVADDASTDNGADIVARLAQEDPRVRLLRLPSNGGKPRAMNIMTARARGNWLAVLDADDAFHPERLTALLEGAQKTGVDMAADNLNYIDAGVTSSGVAGSQSHDPHSVHGVFVRHGFDPAVGDRVIGKADMLRGSSSFADFDFGLLKPVVRRAFAESHRLAYEESSRLAEDFVYLLEYMVAGGRTYVSARALYDWTMPFGTISRRWTGTGAGAWRYDYRPALLVNRKLMDKMSACGEAEIVALLERRRIQYEAMVHYIVAQRLAADGKWRAAALAILRYPVTWRLLVRRVSGRLARAWRGTALLQGAR